MLEANGRGWSNPGDAALLKAVEVCMSRTYWTKCVMHIDDMDP